MAIIRPVFLRGWRMSNATDELERFRGRLLGLAAGDAVGTTVEFAPRGSFPPLTDMTGGGPFRLEPGQWTDDTSMALCLATSLVLEAALWWFLTTDSFAAAILQAANLGDDADTTAAVCGQIAGAYYGESGIPAHWLERLTMREEIASLADRLYFAGRAPASHA